MKKLTSMLVTLMLVCGSQQVTATSYFAIKNCVGNPWWYDATMDQVLDYEDIDIAIYKGDDLLMRAPFIHKEHLHHNHQNIYSCEGEGQHYCNVKISVTLSDFYDTTSITKISHGDTIIFYERGYFDKFSVGAKYLNDRLEC